MFDSSNRFVGPKEVAMDISRNGIDNRKYNEDSRAHVYSKESTDEEKDSAYDESIEIVQNSDTAHVEEALFPSGVKADLQKDIEKSSIGCYIGMRLKIRVKVKNRI